MIRDPIFETVYKVRPCIPTSNALRLNATLDSAFTARARSCRDEEVVNAGNFLDSFAELPSGRKVVAGADVDEPENRRPSTSLFLQHLGPSLHVIQYVSLMGSGMLCAGPEQFPGHRWAAPGCALCRWKHRVYLMGSRCLESLLLPACVRGARARRALWLTTVRLLGFSFLSHIISQNPFL